MLQSIVPQITSPLKKEFPQTFRYPHTSFTLLQFGLWWSYSVKLASIIQKIFRGFLTKFWTLLKTPKQSAARRVVVIRTQLPDQLCARQHASKLHRAVQQIDAPNLKLPTCIVSETNIHSIIVHNDAYMYYNLTVPCGKQYRENTEEHRSGYQPDRRPRSMRHTWTTARSNPDQVTARHPRVDILFRSTSWRRES